jgi:hypothetical protein
VKVVAKGTNIKVYVDDMNTPKIDFSDASFVSGSVGIRAYNSLARWDNLSVQSTLESGLSQSEAQENIKLYPNPTTGDLQVAVPHSGQMSVYDASGKQIFTSGVTPGITTLNTHTYEEGVYLLQLISKEGTGSARFVKMRG